MNGAASIQAETSGSRSGRPGDASGSKLVEMQGELWTRASRLFTGLLMVQWAFAIGLALVISPYAWRGASHELHLHVKLAVLAGAAINAPALGLLRWRPTWWLTRQVVTVVQMSWSALLIHISGGRIETHFHVFASLAFIGIFRDWKLFPTATVVVAADHLVRGVLWPESVYGVANPEWWRFLEHAAWVAFEDVVLIHATSRAAKEMRIAAEREAALVALKNDFENQVSLRTVELTAANEWLATEMEARLQMEAELRQAQKLEAVGRLASGVAHEINTPVQFVSDSLHFVQEAAGEILQLVEKLRVLPRKARQKALTEAEIEAAIEAEDAADLDYLAENVPRALERSLDGLARVATIVRSMKEFAHPDSKSMTSVDLNRAIDSTLTIACNEYKYVADLETHFGDLPRVQCMAGDLNQAILNIVVNAAHAIGDVVAGSNEKGKITVRTRFEDGHAVIAITDTGGGIPTDVRSRIFDPFFTTKAVGKGTGQGLAIARTVVVERHRGTLTFETEMGKGTTFTIRIPAVAELQEAA